MVAPITQRPASTRTRTPAPSVAHKAPANHATPNTPASPAPERALVSPQVSGAARTLAAATGGAIASRASLEERLAKTAAPNSTTPALALPQPPLSRGAQGATVAQLQVALVKAGAMTEAQVNTGVGTFGPRTSAALKTIQTQSGLPATGNYDDATRGALQGILDAPAAPAGATAPSSTGLPGILEANPGIKTNQDLVNHFYREGGNSWVGAETQARQVGLDLNNLVKDWQGDASAWLPSQPPAQPAPPVETPPGTAETPPSTTPPTTPPTTTTPPLTQLLDSHPEIKTHQDLFNHFWNEGGKTWEGASRQAEQVGVSLNDLVANRSGNPREITPRESLPTGPLVIDQPPAQPGVDGKLGDAYASYRQELGNGLTLDPAYTGQVNTVMDRVAQRMPLIDEIARRADLPREVVAAIWEHEAGGMPTDVYLHNGEKLGSPTTLVPKGVYFGKDQFVEAAVDALRSKRGVADELGLHYGSKDVAAMAAYTEAYNGFGFRNRGVESGYVTAGTDFYQGGRYVADGVFDANAWERRPGTLPLMLEMMRRFP